MGAEREGLSNVVAYLGDYGIGEWPAGGPQINVSDMTDVQAGRFECKRPYDPWLDGPLVWDGTWEVIEIPLPPYAYIPVVPLTKDESG